MLCLGIALAALAQTAPAPADPVTTDAELPSGDIADILKAELLEADGEPALDPGSLADALAIDFAHTPTLERRIAELRAPQHVQQDNRWQVALEQRLVENRIRGLAAHQALVAQGRVTFDIPLADDPLVDSYIQYFTGRGRYFFETWLGRADRYVPLMQPILRERGLPEDLVYLAMIESGFSSKALSTASASGFWQFIGSTGKLYKLRQDNWIDERRDFVRATEAAASYLSYLYKDFGDWHLAWAGYNGGEGRIRRARAKAGGGDFWSLSASKHIAAQETRHYVPKIIAAAIVAKDRERYGFKVKSLSQLSWDDVPVEDSVDFKALSRAFGIDVEELRVLNPALLYDITPPGTRYMLRVPKGRGAEVVAGLESLPRSERLTYRQHKVQKGESLSKIASRYGTSINIIREFNTIGRYLAVGQLLVVPSLKKERTVVGHDQEVRSQKPKVRAQTAGTQVAGAAAPVKAHRVAPGETLWAIAQRYGVSVDELKSWNGRRSSRIGVGEVLQIYRDARPQS